MYHIKEDKRSKRSAQAISDALEQLISEKPFMEITVSDIHRRSGVGRSTFYRLFDNIDDVVSYMVDTQFRASFSNYGDLSWRELAREYLSVSMGKSAEVMSIVTSGRIDLIIRSFRQSLTDVFTESGMDPGSISMLQYGFAIFASSSISILRIWEETGKKESLDELVDILERYLNYSELSA